MAKIDEKPIDVGFWKKVKENADAEKRPIFVLAPMADVTDEAFRRIIAKYSRMGKKGGGPDVMWTEFVSADGLCSLGRDVLMRDLAFSDDEHPIVAQLFTSRPEKMRSAAHIVASLGFDGLDINMGCPDRSIEKQKAGAAMMKDIESAIAVIQAAREGIGGKQKSIGEEMPLIPVSVKTRIGYNKVEIDTWIRALLEQRLPVLTVHLRTRKEMSDVPAHWELMPEIVKLRDKISPETLIIGNGDAESLEDAQEKAEKTGCDGIMFGRAIFGNPWLFDREAKNQKTIAERLRVMAEHTDLFIKLLGDVKSFAIMKKHYKAYVNGWVGAKELRVTLMEAKSVDEVKAIVDSYFLSTCTIAS